MSSEVALESVNSRVGLGGKASKSFSIKNEGDIGFRGLVFEKRESVDKPAKRNAAIGQSQKEKVLIKAPGKPKAHESSKELQNPTKESKTESDLADFEQSEIVQIEQIPQPEIVLVKAEELQLQETEESEQVGQVNVNVENNFELLENEPLISLSQPKQPMTDFPTKTEVASGDTEINTELPEEHENEIAASEVNAYPVISLAIQNDNNTTRLVKNLTKGVAVVHDYVEEIKNDNGEKENKINLAGFEGIEKEEALLARLSSQNFKGEIKSTEPSKINPIIVTESVDSKAVAVNDGEVEISVKLESAAKGIELNISQNEPKVAKLDVQHNINTIFADTSRAGQEILTAMRDEHRKITPEFMNEELVVAENLPELLEGVEIYTDLENNNSSNSKFATEIFSFGGTIETNQDDRLVVSFKENLVVKSDNTPHRSEQIALSIKEAVSSGKSNVTINMYPKALGAIDIHIEFSTIGGKQVVESIKITAERRDTLDIIQKSEAELRKNLTEVTKSSEDASLEFNLKHNDSNGGRGNYFQDLEERQNWMNKFQQQTDKVGGLNSAAGYSDQNGYITEDSVNIIA